MSRYPMNTFLSFASSCFLPVLYNLSPFYMVALTSRSTLFRILLARMSLPEMECLRKRRHSRTYAH